MLILLLASHGTDCMTRIHKAIKTAARRDDIGVKITSNQKEERERNFGAPFKVASSFFTSPFPSQNTASSSSARPPVGVPYQSIAVTVQVSYGDVTFGSKPVSDIRVELLSVSTNKIMEFALRTGSPMHINPSDAADGFYIRLVTQSPKFAVLGYIPSDLGKERDRYLNDLVYKYKTVRYITRSCTLLMVKSM